MWLASFTANKDAVKVAQHGNAKDHENDTNAACN
jgi:hypothetical protein